MMDENVLLNQCIRGDERAWSEFLRRYRAIIYGSILKTLAVRGEPHERAEDIFQDVFLKLLSDDCRALRRFQRRSRTTTWLARIAINATIDAVRRRRARREVSDAPGADSDSESPAEEILKHIAVDARILENVSARDMAERLLDRLDEPDGLILKMYFFGGLKEREIADLLGVPINTLSSRKSRALEKLKSAARELLRVSSDEVGNQEPSGSRIDEENPR